MTHEEFQHELQSIPDRKLIEDCTIKLQELCKTGGKSFVMHVPPQLTDTDMLIGELIHRFEEKVIL